MTTTLLNATSHQLQAECLRRAIHNADEHILNTRTALAKSEQKQANRIKELAHLSALIYQANCPADADLGRTVTIAQDAAPLPLSTESTPSIPSTPSTEPSPWVDAVPYFPPLANFTFLLSAFQLVSLSAFVPSNFCFLLS